MSIPATQSIARKWSSTRTDYAYESDSDLDWMRDQFAGGAAATAPNATWMGVDYGYDKSGRMTLMSSTDNRIMGAIPAVDANGAANNINQVASVAGRAAMTWSAAGNMATDGKGTTFTHDGRNMLMRAARAGLTMDYAYNTDGMRIESIKNATGTNSVGMPTGGTRTRYMLSGSEEVADLNADRSLIARYISGAAIDERVAQIDANGAITFMHNDKQNSVIAISDAVGNPVVRRGYGTYGETDPAQMVGTTSAGTSPHPFGYTGRRWDPDLGLYYYRARWYDPQLGTFLQTDPIGSLDYVNLYSYVGAEPGNATDPTGMTAVACIGRQTASNSIVITCRRSAETYLPITTFSLRFYALDGSYSGGVSRTYFGNVSTQYAFDGATIHPAKTKKPPSDAHDPNGAKAPGKPGEAEGFEDPPSGPVWGQDPRSRGWGWVDKEGDVWVPTGGKGAHGGDHWDVQGKNRGRDRNVYPGGRVRWR
jgi:RHS repeat-associated protein